MIKAIIIDDEVHSIETLKWKIEANCPSVEVVMTFSDPTEGLRYILDNPIDILFLDIEMPILNGFDLLQKIPNPQFDVIFTTAYDEYGIRAIKNSALDYLLKPIDINELILSITKYQKNQSQNILPQQLEALYQNLHEANSNNQKIALATKESIELVKPADIVVCESDNNYTMVYIDGRKKLISKTLKEFEELLTPYNFIRTHQSFLVNIDHIAEYIRIDGGYLVMKNGMRVSVSRNKKEALMKLF